MSAETTMRWVWDCTHTSEFVYVGEFKISRFRAVRSVPESFMLQTTQAHGNGRATLTHLGSFATLGEVLEFIDAHDAWEAWAAS